MEIQQIQQLNFETTMMKTSSSICNQLSWFPQDFHPINFRLSSRKTIPTNSISDFNFLPQICTSTQSTWKLLIVLNIQQILQIEPQEHTRWNFWFNFLQPASVETSTMKETMELRCAAFCATSFRSHSLFRLFSHTFAGFGEYQIHEHRMPPTPFSSMWKCINNY
jgi:hypothetical protein